MEDADKAKLGTETLKDQFTTVKKETTQSPVLQWGQLSLQSEPIGNFEAATFAEEMKNFW